MKGYFKWKRKTFINFSLAGHFKILRKNYKKFSFTLHGGLRQTQKFNLRSPSDVNANSMTHRVENVPYSGYPGLDKNAQNGKRMSLLEATIMFALLKEDGCRFLNRNISRNKIFRILIAGIKSVTRITRKCIWRRLKNPDSGAHLPFKKANSFEVTHLVPEIKAANADNSPIMVILKFSIFSTFFFLFWHVYLFLWFNFSSPIGFFFFCFIRLLTSYFWNS